MGADERAFGQLGEEPQRRLARGVRRELVAALDLDPASAGERHDRGQAPRVRARNDPVDRVLGELHWKRAGMGAPGGIEPAGAIVAG